MICCRTRWSWLRQFPHVPPGHRPERMAAPDHDQHPHQQLSQDAASASAVSDRGRLPRTIGGKRPAYLDRASVCRRRGIADAARQRHSGTDVGRAREVPHRGLLRRRARFALQRDRQDPSHPRKEPWCLGCTVGDSDYAPCCTIRTALSPAIRRPTAQPNNAV